MKLYIQVTATILTTVVIDSNDYTSTDDLPASLAELLSNTQQNIADSIQDDLTIDLDKDVEATAKLTRGNFLSFCQEVEEAAAENEEDEDTQDEE